MKLYDDSEMKVIIIGADDIRTDNGGTSGEDGGSLSSADDGLGLE